MIPLVLVSVELVSLSMEPLEIEYDKDSEVSGFEVVKEKESDDVLVVVIGSEVRGWEVLKENESDDVFVEREDEKSESEW